ncbi:MAG TPA: hypothetical protein VFO36_06040, partial [Nitrospiraceae bacterium]|nr:hypothetical protein [Nitrospiraceae bacterium]
AWMKISAARRPAATTAPHGAALLMAISHAQQMVTMLAAQAFAKERHEWILDGTLDDPRYFDAVAKAINLVLRALHPTNPVGTGWKRSPPGAQLQWKDISVLAAEVAVAGLLPGKWRSK